MSLSESQGNKIKRERDQTAWSVGGNKTAEKRHKPSKGHNDTALIALDVSAPSTY